MHNGGIILLRLRRRLMPRCVLHPGRGARRGVVIEGFYRDLIGILLLVLILRPCAWLNRQIGPPHGGERIVLANQARQLRQRITLALGRCARLVAAIIVVVSRETSVLISINHRDDASPRGKAANPLVINEPALAGSRSQIPPRSGASINASRPEHRRRERPALMPKPKLRPEP